jgi:hypothetical protein
MRALRPMDRNLGAEPRPRAWPGCRAAGAWSSWFALVGASVPLAPPTCAAVAARWARSHQRSRAKGAA